MNANLTDEFLLLVYDHKGAPRASAQTVAYGLAGALLMELMLAERVTVPAKKLVVADPTPTGDPVIDQALARVHGDRRGRKPKDWIGPLSKGLRERTLDRLVATGELRREEQRVFGIFPRTRYPWASGAEPPVAAEARQRLRIALDATGPIEPRTAALCALVRAAGIEELAVPDRPKREVRARLAEIAEANWPAEAVRKAISELEAAVATSITAATVSASITR